MSRRKSSSKSRKSALVEQRGEARPGRGPVDSAPSPRIELFPSAMGWIGAALRNELLIRLTCGHETRRAALAALGGDPRRAGPPETALARRLMAFADGAPDDFLDVPLDLAPFTEFQQAVLLECRRIPYGRVLTYGQLAAKAGYPGAARAVGNVMAANRFPLIVPCHRVVGAGGALGGYSAPAGLDMKRRLLQHEGSLRFLQSP